MSVPKTPEWSESLLMRRLFPHLFVDAGTSSRQAVLEALFRLSLELAPAVMGRNRALSAEEVTSDLIDLFIAGYLAPAYDPGLDPRSYLRGIVATLVPAHDRKHRHRGCRSMEAAQFVADDRTQSPVDALIHRELVELARGIWLGLSPRRQEAIRAGLGSVFPNDGSPPVANRKNYAEKHRGVRQMEGSFAAMGITEL